MIQTNYLVTKYYGEELFSFKTVMVNNSGEEIYRIE